MAEPLLEIEGVEVRRGMGTVLSDFTLALHPEKSLSFMASMARGNQR